jgi:hypothetical protein
MSRLVKIFSTIGLIAALAFISVPNAEARGRGGLNVSIYDLSNSRYNNDEAIFSYQPWRYGPVGSLCARVVLDTIDQNFDPQYGSCGPDDFLVHYNGYLKVPRTGVYTFYAAVDDGFHLQLGREVVLYDWESQGAYDFNVEGDIRLTQGRAYELNAWLNQGGGGKDAHLYYSVRGSEPQLVPASWFSPRR